MSKKGRPQAFHRASWGERIDGLTRLADGRWKVSGPKAVKFTEADERLAVARFKKLTATDNNLGKLAVHPDALSAMWDIARRTIDAGNSLSVEIEQLPDGGGYALRDDTLTSAQWAWLRKAILDRGQWVAQKVGIEQLGWLSDVKRPGVSPKLAELIDLYAAKPGLSSNEASRSKLFWKEFTRAVGLERIGDLTHENIVAYEQKISGGGYAAKSILHRYRKVRCVLAYAIKRGKGIEDCRRALDITAMLEIRNHTPLDPRPVLPDQFWAIHKAALQAGDDVFAAMMLTALNAAMYGGEVSALLWSEVDLKTGELVTRRPKTGVSRIAVLWPETLAAIRKLDRQGDHIFYSARRSYYANAVVKTWRRYCTAAGVADNIVFSQLRDAAFSTACSISVDQAKLLAGHRLSGASDHYVRRNPSLVADACKAIRTAFITSRKSVKRERFDTRH